ncbi:hypothetical protein ACGF12_34435 [Kitasatospora sp. NPDC048296]|uniref:hypothetical protein n=1 Tax=Kitasatospora sp. NPDC048296 TaxID=3364048 RepID=UPI0037237B2E
MGRLSSTELEHNEAAIRAAMDRLLRGELPPGGKCDIKTLASEAGVTRTGFYAKGTRPGPYQHLAEEFERRLKALEATDGSPDPRDTQITRLKGENTVLRERIARRETTIAELTSFKTLALSRLAAQHDEIQSLRKNQAEPTRLQPLPTPIRIPATRPCS